MAVQIPRVYNGSPLDESYWETMASTVEAHDAAIPRLSDPTRAKLRASVSQSINNNSWTALNFNTEDVDVGGGHSTVTNTSRWVAPESGMVLVSGVYSPASNATGRRGIRWAKNGTVIPSSQSMVLAGTTSLLNIASLTHMVPVVAGDFIEVQAFQESGGSLGTQGSPDEAQSGMNILLVAIS